MFRFGKAPPVFVRASTKRGHSGKLLACARQPGGGTQMKKLCQVCLSVLLMGLAAGVASAQSFRVQCPPSTTLHSGKSTDQGAIKCQQISGGDGFSTMADGTQTYMFSFGPLSGLRDIQAGLLGTEPGSIFNSVVDPNGAVGITPDPNANNTITGHVDPRKIMDIGVMNGNIPAPMMAIDEDDEFFLTLSNVGMIMRPALFEQHTVHFHGYPNASSYYDGVPDASVAINIGGSFTYYYLAPDAGTYFWHCHITPPEHLQMGMVGQLYVRPRQNRVPVSTNLYTARAAQDNDLRTACRRPGDGVTPAVTNVPDILCSNPLPAVATTAAGGGKYAYNDGDGSTAYDVEYPLQMHGFDPNFHFVGMTFNPEAFVDMKDKYFLLNGRSYPDTVGGYQCVASDLLPACNGHNVNDVVPGPMQTQSTDGTNHASQPLPTVINIPANGHALLRISDLDVSEYQTLASLGIPMRVVGLNARLLRDMAGNNMAYQTNSITLAGGESIDVMLDATGISAGQKFYLYTPNLDHLSNDAENFGGLMTEINICKSVDPTTKICTNSI